MRHQLRDCILRNLGGQARVLGIRIQGGPSGFSQKNSVVLMVDDEVKGAIMAKPDGKLALVPVDVVNLDLRGGWANLWLKWQITKNLLEGGVEKMRFTINPDVHQDTLKFARRVNAATLREQRMYVHILGDV